MSLRVKREKRESVKENGKGNKGKMEGKGRMVFARVKSTRRGRKTGNGVRGKGRKQKVKGTEGRVSEE